MTDQQTATLLAWAIVGKPVLYRNAVNWIIVRVHTDGRLRIEQPGGERVDVAIEEVCPAWSGGP